MSKQQQQQLDEQINAEINRTAGQSAAKAAATATHNKLEKRKQNPEFLDKLRDLGIDTDEYGWISDRVGPLQAGVHLIGNRSEDYETEIKWLDQNRAERIIAEGEPGRLCRGRLLSLAQRVHNREDKERVDPMTMDERRVIRDAMEAITNFKSLSVGARGMSAMTEATTVTKSERSQREDKTRKERLAQVIG